MDIEKLAIDTKAQQEGERIDCARFGFPDIYVTTRSVRSTAFQIEYERLQQRLLREKREDKTLPARERRALSDADKEVCYRGALLSKCLIDVEGLTQKGSPLSFPDVISMMAEPRYVAWVGLFIQAAQAVGHPEGDLYEEDAGNSQRPSGGTSGTAEQQVSSPT